MVNEVATSSNEAHAPSGHSRHLVEITFDGNPFEIERGKYSVDALRTVLGVPADNELDMVVDGLFNELAGSEEIHVKGGEVFVSHLRRGGSS